MKKVFEVSDWKRVTAKTIFIDQREAFTLAKEIAKETGLAIMTMIERNNENRIETYETIAVKSDGSFDRW